MLSPRWQWLALLACAGTAQGVFAQARPPEPEAAPAGAEQAAPAEEAQGGGWGLPPVRMSGHLSYNFTGSRGDGEGASAAHLVTASTALSSYIYAPWLARVDAELGLTQGWSRSEGGLLFGGSALDAALHETIRSRERFITGRGRVNVFPQSRFPFEVHVERTDSRLDSGLASTFNFQTSNIGFSQRYRPPGGEYTLFGAYDHHVQTAEGHRGVQDTFSSDFNRRGKKQELGLGFTHSRSHTETADDESRFTSLVARHGFTPTPALSVDTTANVTRAEDRGFLASSDLRTMQLSSVGVYRRPDSPLQLTGSVLGLVLRDEDNGNRINSGNATLGASYAVNERLQMTASGGVNAVQANGDSAAGLNGAVGVSYQGPSVEFRGFRYDWFSSGSGSTALSTTSTGPVLRQSNLNASGGHSIGRTWMPFEGVGLSVNGSQSLGWSRAFSNDRREDSVGLGSNVSLQHNAAATLQGGSGSRTGYARVSFSDARELGGEGSRFQLFNAQISGNWEIDSRRSLTGDLTFQRTWESSNQLPFPGEPILSSGRTGSMAASGEITYRHARLWGQPRLTFSSRLKLAQDVLRQPGFLASLPDRETAFWENRLDWGIGRLDTQLVLRMSIVDGRRRDAIMFRIQRSFGD